MATRVTRLRLRRRPLRASNPERPIFEAEASG